MYYNEYSGGLPLLYLGVEVLEELGIAVNYSPSKFGTNDEIETLWTSSFQGFEVGNKTLDLKFAKTSKSHFYVEYI